MIKLAVIIVKPLNSRLFKLEKKLFNIELVELNLSSIPSNLFESIKDLDIFLKDKMKWVFILELKLILYRIRKKS